MELLPKSFLQIALGTFPSFQYFLEFSLLIFIFLFLLFIISPFVYSAPFQASSFP